ncbi:MAG: serine/threonine protein kinase [Deltaproteobacteria bacterium]|nr:serine/threonine protein kinase [Deltaproteobacteria bacterium]
MAAEDIDVDADLPPGTQVGEYTVENRLGAGAFGVVYKASHPVIGKQVAIKVLSLKFSVDPEASTRFVAEARAVNQIRHRHIIDIFSFGKLPDGRQYYVMEYLDGETMDALLERERKLPLDNLVPILRGIAKALDAAHAKNVAHRDLKPENVFLARDEAGVFPKLLDFGIAKLLGNEQGGMTAKTRSGIAVGTPYFMSPEQARGRELDHRTDVYSFGVLVYLSLTGTYPFDGDDHISILMQHVTADAEAPSARVPELPPAVDEIVLQLLQKDPAARPENLRTAVAALERAAGLAPSVDTGPVALRSQPVAVAAAPTAFVETPKRRPRTWAIVPALAAIAVIGVAVVALTGKRHEKAPAKPEAPPAPVVVKTLPPPPAPAPVQPPAPPPPVTLDITGVPTGSEVLVAGKVIGTAPGPVQLPQSASATVVVVQAEGYQPLSTIVVPDRDQPLSLTLKKKPAAKTGAQKPGRDDIIDVFGGNK